MAKGNGGNGGGGGGSGGKNPLQAVDDNIQVSEELILYTAYLFTNDTVTKGYTLTGAEVAGSSNILTFTTDQDGNDSTITINGQYGTLVLEADGRVVYHMDTASMQYLAVGEAVHEVFTYYVTDNTGATSSANLDFIIEGRNDAPTVILFNDTFYPSVNENEAAGTLISTLSAVDVDLSDTHTFSLVDGAYDNNLFQIVGNELRTNATFDYETQNTYTVSLVADDGHGGTVQQTYNIHVNDVNEAPTDIKIDGADSDSVDENLPAGTTVGILTAADPDISAAHTFSLVAGAGDNSLFEIVGNELRTTQSFDYESQGPLTVYVQADDGNGGVFTKALTISLNDVNDAPIDIKLDGMSSDSVDENLPAGTTVGILTAVDQDAGDAHTFSLVAGAGDNSLFEIVGNELRTTQSFDYESQGPLTAYVQADDGNGGVFTKALTISLNDVNEAPTDIKINGMASGSIDENLPAGTTVGSLTAVDQDAGDSHTFSLVAGAGDNSLFEIVGNDLLATQSFDFETQGPFSVVVQAVDNQGETVTKAITIAVNDVIEQITAVDDVHTPDGRVTDSSVGYQAEAISVVLTDGSSVIVWAGDNSNTYARQFDMNGEPLGDEFIVNSNPNEYTGWAYASALSDGGFVVVWDNYSTNNVSARVFDGDGTPRGDDINVGASNFGSPYVASVGNSFVVTWEVSDGVNDGIHARQFGLDGSAMTGDFLVNDAVSSGLELSSVTGLSDGSFVVSWNGTADTNNDGTADTFGVFVRHFDAASNPLSGDIMVNQTAFSDSSWSKVTALADGGFVMVWQGDAQQGTGIDIYGRTFDANGQMGDEFVVNTTMSLDQQYASVQGLSDGSFVVVWSGNGATDDQGIFGQHFNADGSMIGPEFQVNVETAGDQALPFLNAFADDTLLVSWDAFNNADSDVFSMHIDANGGTESLVQLVDVLSNDVNPSGGPLTISNLYFTDPTIAASDASLAVVDNKVAFDPGTAFEHLDTGESVNVEFSYTVDDGSGYMADALASVLVLGSYDPPVI